MKVVFISPYPNGIAPSQRFRFEMYLDILEERGIKYQQFSFYSYEDYQSLYKRGYINKVFIVLKGNVKRLFHLFTVLKSDKIFLHREASPLGPPWFEFLIGKIFKKDIIYDFDDAIWLPDLRGVNKMATNLKSYSKTKKIIRWSTSIIVGNSYLAEYAKKYNPRVIILPTMVDTEYHKRKKDQDMNKPLVIGWTGSHSTAGYMESLFPLIDELSKTKQFQFRFISNQPPKTRYTWLEYVPWDIATEIEDLSTLDIGLMPLDDDEWSRGKCGFKLIQYMALEIAAIGSNVGVNNQIIDHDANGLLAKDQSEFIHFISMLLENPSKIKLLGKSGRESIIRNYSKVSLAESFFNIILS